MGAFITDREEWMLIALAAIAGGASAHVAADRADALLILAESREFDDNEE